MPVIYIHAINGDHLPTLPSPPCVHTSTRDRYYQYLLHICIEDTPYIAMSCALCKSITLYNLRDATTTSAYRDPTSGKPAPGRMCKGPPGTLLAVDIDTNELAVFDCSSTTFELKDTIAIVGLHPIYISFAETSHMGGLVVASNRTQSIISATSFAEKQQIWRLQGAVLGRMIEPGGMCSNSRGQLYIADSINKRILLLDGGTGYVLQVRGYLACSMVQ